MLPYEIIGLVAGAFITGGFIPQVVRVLRLKSAREISLPFTIFFLAGTSLWLTYGALLALPALIFWNSAAFILGSLLLFAKLRYGK